MIAQTVQFTGISPETLYTAYLSSREHSAMTAGSRPAFFSRPSVGEVVQGQEGDELRAFGFTGPDGQPQFSLHARILQLVPGKLIVLTWKDYKVSVPETGEIGALSSIVNTHWSLLYWEPMRAYFQKGEVSA